MTELKLIASEEPADRPFSTTLPLPRRLPHGRHGIPADIVVQHQRQRLLAGVAEALAEHGYARLTTTIVSELAGVSSGTFYKHFGNLWDCLLAAYVATADRLCEEIEAACAASGPGPSRIEAGIDAALAFFTDQPALAQLVGSPAPRDAIAMGAARRLLISRLASMLRRGRNADDDALEPPALDERLIDAALAFVYSQVAAGEAERLADLGPELVAILDRPRCAA